MTGANVTDGASRTPPATSEVFRTRWSALYDGATGQLDARQIADALGTTLPALAEALGLVATDVEHTPSAEEHQAALRPVARMLELLHDSLPDDAPRRAWLTRPRADMEDAPPLAVVLAGEVGALISLLEGAQLGNLG